MPLPPFYFAAYAGDPGSVRGPVPVASVASNRAFSLGAAPAGHLDSSVDDPVVSDTTPPPRPWLSWLAPAIPVASAFLLALTRIEDPDAFTHLALGRDLVQQRGFPAHEPFSFGSLDLPYYNSE